MANDKIDTIDKLKRQERLKRSQRLRIKRQFFHPTHIPVAISLSIFFLAFIVGAIFHLSYPKWIQDVLSILFFISIGISGLIILIRREFVGKYGEISHGWEVYLYGTSGTLIGFGLSLFILYNLLSS